MVKLRIGPVVKQYAVVILANFPMLYVGLAVSWPSPVLVKLRNVNQTVLPHPTTEDQASWIVAIPPLAGMIMMLLTSYLIDRLGRKAVVILVCVPRLTMFLFYLFANDIWMIYFGRCLSGMCDVVTVSVMPTYASEIANKEIRGALGTVLQVISAIGMMIMLALGPYISYFSINLVCSCIIVIFTIPLFFLPESPYHLYSKGRIDDSMKVLIFLRGSEELAREEVREYAMIPEEKVKKWEIFKNTVVLKTVLKVIVLSAGLQIIGYSAISYYLQTIFESTQTSVTPEMSSLVIGCIQLLACFCTILVTDRFGRKPILISSLVGMAVGMVGLGLFFKLMEDQLDVTGFMNYLPLVSMILVIFCFNSGMGSLFWMLIAELFDGPSRASGVSLAVFATTIFNFITTKYFGTVTVAIGPPATYWMFSANCIIIGLFIKFFVPETTGKTFSEIQGALGRADGNDNRSDDKI